MKFKLRLFKIKEVAIVSVLLLVILTSVSVGYAIYNENLDLSGEVVLNKVGMVEITTVGVSKESNITNTNYNTSSHFVDGGTNVNFDITATAKTASSGEINYKVKFKNNSTYTYTFTGLEYANNASYVAPRLLDMLKGQVLKPGEEIEATVIIFSEEAIPATTYLEYNITFKFEQGEVECDATPLEVRNKNETEFTYSDTPVMASLKVINIQDVSMKYTVSLSNPKLKITNADGNEILITNIVTVGDSDTNNIYISAEGLDPGEYTTEILMNMEDGRIYHCPNKITITVEEKSALLPGVKSQFVVKELWSHNYTIFLDITNTNDYDIDNFTVYFKINKTIQNMNYYGLYQHSYDTDTQIFKLSNTNRHNSNLTLSLKAGETVDLLNSNGGTAYSSSSSQSHQFYCPDGLTVDDLEIIYMSTESETFE